MNTNTRKKRRVDQFVRGIFLASTLLSASFIIIIIIFIVMKGITPFITDNDGLGVVNIWTFLTGSVWLQGTAFQSNLYAVGILRFWRY